MKMNQNMDAKVDAYKEGMAQMGNELPRVTEAYHAFTGECFANGALNAKQKQLIALGIGLFANNEICTLYHVEEAISSGASDQEIMETAAVAAALGGGHAMSQGVTRLRQALHGKKQIQ